MSNPTPILNNINAFDATKGTAISFNIIGGTDIVRSNIVYIYDLGTNDLICTHLYISTESIHELPPNTDPSIVYASGKSSADFVNNKNYYLQIQTFTNTAGTAGGSGMSVAKTFWCLSNPSLSVNAIPAAISTTSYNVGATYNTNVTDTSIPVTNIIQQYKFDLYTATGTLVQTSGNIIGSGEQEGTSTTYNITYNFSGLVVNNSYYVVVTTTSTEGMTVSAQSNTFTVSIETPTVGAATATNNSCDGYISVVSNLSSEYGGNVSGEIASFETDSVNNVSSLKVNMEPIQDLHGYDHPWVGGAGANLLNLDREFTFTTTKTVTFESPIPSGTTIYFRWDRHTYETEPSTGDKKIAVRFQGANSEAIGISLNDGDEYSLSLTFDATLIIIYSNGYNYTASSGVTTTVTGMVLAKTSQTSWSPYENICPISGWDSVDVVVSPTQSAEDGTTYTTDLNQTVYGGTLDMATGVLTVDRKMVTLDGVEKKFRGTWGATNNGYAVYWNDDIPRDSSAISNRFVASRFGVDNMPLGSFVGNSGVIGTWTFILPSSITSKNEADAWLVENPTTIVYHLTIPQTYQLTPHQIQTLVGQNDIWSDAGDVDVTFNLPITNLLVKRQDTSDTSGKWLTLYSQPIAQASDMDFTYIDFLNQHGKTYRYALVPLLTQQQGDVDVEIEGGYTVSDDVLSVFDGVFIANSNGSQKLKANTEYGDLETNQDVGVLTTIGGKYPFVVSNSNLNYHSGSISALIVPSDFYTNGDLDRLDIVERREAIEQFLTDKTAKILKDWNGNIWLITFVDNVEVSFVDDYGMGLGTLSAKWVEIGDVNDQTDLQQTGLI